jgi:hypothetical protein
MERSGYINVDEVMPQVSLEQVAQFYGATLPELRRVGNETRSACFLNCGKAAPTGDRALSIQADTPQKTFYCHAYGCAKNGNLVSMCDLLKPGPSMNGRPRGERFKGIAADLQAMANGEMAPAGAPAAPIAPPAPLRVNIPLKDSDNERARGLTELDRKFLVDVPAMSPRAAGYFRKRPFLTPDVCRRWRAGYLPRDAGGEDKSGGTMRGKVVYAYRDPDGDVLTWFGRDPEFEEKHRTWGAGDKTDREPEKFHFVKGFHRGLELFGQHALRAPEAAEKLRKCGLIVVEGPNDVIRLDTLGVPAVALCANTITREQAMNVATLASELAEGLVTVFLDCDPEGVNGAKQCLALLAELTPVRLAWSEQMFGGKFRGRQPESLGMEDWTEIESYLTC